MINWSTIDTVLLDMDGTLLDLHFDNHFWLEHLPLRYAQHVGRPLELVHTELMTRIDREQGTLNWYCLDYWTRELGMDIRQLKEEVQHLISFRPQVQDFLAELKHSHQRLILVTNAHRKSLSLKLSLTGLDQYFDQVISSHDFGMPKEDVLFWEALQQVEPFDKSRTLLIDDSASVLRSAHRYGIGHLLTILQPDSRKAPRPESEFPGLLEFAQIRLGASLNLGASLTKETTHRETTSPSGKAS